MVLLDTHVLLWANLKPSLLSAEAAAILGKTSEVVAVSAASAWEIATKVRLGKLPGAEVFEAEFDQLTERTGYVLLPIQVSTALRAGRLQGKHRDPFDRFLAAQALEVGIPILSADAALDEFGIRRVW